MPPDSQIIVNVEAQKDEPTEYKILNRAIFYVSRLVSSQHRLIGALLSTELKEQEKLDIIEHEYNIPISNELREDVRIMCNLSTGIEEKATEKTSEKFILNMYKKGYTLDQIADVAETSVEVVETIIKKKEPAMA